MKRISAYLLIVMNILFTATNSNAMKNNETKEPMQIPINILFDITKSGNKSEIVFKIEKSDKYVFGLNFYEDNKTREAFLKKKNKLLDNGFIKIVKLFTLVPYYKIKNSIFPPEQVVREGYEPSRLVSILGRREDKKDGVQTPMKLKLYKINQVGEEELIYDEVSMAVYSPTVRQRVIDVIELVSGVYKVEIEAVKDNVLLKDFLSDLIISGNYMIGNDASLDKQRTINFKK